MWDELSLLKNSKPCTCEAMEDTHRDLEEEHMMGFLMGLNDCFEAIRQQILILNPLPTVSQAYAMVLQVEEQMSVSTHFSDPVEHNAMYSGYKTGYKGDHFRKRLTREEKVKLKCDHCGGIGHVKMDCFELIGVPEWYRKFKADKAQGRAHYTTFDQGSDGRLEQDSPRTEQKHDTEVDSVTNMSKFVESEVAKHIAAYFKQGIKPDQTMATAHLAEINRGDDSVTYTGHYAFGVNTWIKRNEWIVDSGASSHMCCHIGLLSDLKRLKDPIQIFLPDGSIIWVFLTGTARLNQKITLQNVFFAPAFTHNLLSVGQLTKDLDGKVEFLASHCLIQGKKPADTLGICSLRGSLYVFPPENLEVAFTSTVQQVSSLLDLHCRLGHPSITAMKHLHISNKRFRGEDFEELHACKICFEAKQQREPFPVLNRRSSSLFALIHMDVWGPCQDANVSNTPYFLTIVEDHSRATWTFLFKTKSQVWHIVNSFIVMVKTRFKIAIQCMRTDNGGEFVNRQMADLFNRLGILHQKSCPYTPQQNGVVERKHKHLLQVARALMFQSQLPSKFWSYSVLHATWLINRLPTTLLHWESPYQVLFGCSANLTSVYPFGCLVYKANIIHMQSKFDKRSLECIFMGYSSQNKGILLYDLQSHQISVGKDVKVFPTHFPLKIDTVPELPFQSFLPLLSLSTAEAPLTDSCISHSQDNFSPLISYPSAVPPDSDSDTIAAPDIYSHSDDPVVLPYQPLRRSTRNHQPPAYLQDYEPNSYQEACQYVEWVEAMNTELHALQKNNTWDLVQLPPGKHAIGCKWVYKVKLQSDGQVERFKARLVAKGYNQEFGTDYTEVFSPVAKLVTVRLFFTFASQYSWHLHQVDVNNAFLHGILTDEIYMHIPQGLPGATGGLVCKLKKSLYGLKQASREWNNEFCKLLLASGFHQSENDHCLFTRGTHNSFIALLVYVDDILLLSPSLVVIDQLKTALHDAFTIKDLGEAKYFLGMEVARSSTGYYLCQRKYILDLLSHTGMLGCKPVHTPLPPGLSLSQHGGDPLPTPASYRQLVGKLMYLNLTRPDLSFAIQQLSQFMNQPQKHH